jgi:hypothetical protein
LVVQVLFVCKLGAELVALGGEGGEFGFERAGAIAIRD